MASPWSGHLYRTPRMVESHTMTMTALEIMRAQQPTPPPEPTPTPPPKPLPDPAPMDEIVVGDRGKMVQQVQLNLDVFVDGVYGKTTAAAVAAFQKENKIKVTGTVNKRTWNKLFQWPAT
jgi:peptidoglycan hydrolase-like protein with peptidoglycan-binding domain